MNSYQDLLVNSITVLSDANSSSICSGAITVNGGVGIKGNLYVGGNIIGNLSNCNNNCNNGCNNSCNFTSINSNIIPSMNNCFNIGCTSKIWKEVFCDSISVNQINKDLIPSTNECLNIGNLSKMWKSLYLSDELTVPCINTSTIKSNNNLSITNNVCITGNLTVSGTITSTCNNCENNSNNCNNNSNTFNYNLIPACTNTFSIGEESKRWKNVYLSENLHIGINNDFVNVNAINKLLSINGSGTSNSVYGESLNISYSGCSTQDATVVLFNHISGSNAGTKLQFNINNNKSCLIGTNYINNLHTFVIAPNDGNVCDNKILINASETNIMNNVNCSNSINVNESIKYGNNLIHSHNLSNINDTIINTDNTFTEITIDQEYKELVFTYDKCTLERGHVKYFIVTDISVSNCTCDTPHYKIIINDLVAGTGVILSSIGQSVGVVWTSQNKWSIFSGNAIIIT